jgi:putative transposase
MIKAHKIRLNPTLPQEAYFYRASGVARFAWNWALEEYKRRKAAGQEIDWNEIKKEFRARIETEFPFVQEVTKCAAEVAISDLRQAINTYYKTKQANPKSRVKFPGPRKRSKKIGGFGLNNDKFSVSGHTVYVPKLGEVNMAEALRFDGRILNGRIKEQAGRWYLTITVEIEPVAQAVARLPRSVGIDFGLSRFATLSNGEKSETQAHYRQAEGKLKRLQRGLARKKKGSNTRREKPVGYCRKWDDSFRPRSGVTCADILRTIFSYQIVNGSVQTVASNMNGTKTARSISKWKACAFSPEVATSA